VRPSVRLFAPLALALFLACGCRGPAAPAAPDAPALPASRLCYFSQGAKPGFRTPYGDNPAAGRTVAASDGAALWLETYGPEDGPAVLVLHGGGVGSPYEMAGLLDALRAAGCRVLSLSTRGHGRSAIGTAPLSFDQRVSDAVSALDAAGVAGPVRILGFSDGAYTALALAARRPGRADRVVAIGAGTVKPGAFAAENPFDALERADPAFMAQAGRLSPDGREARRAAMGDYMAFWHRARVGEETFSAVRCPLLLVAGDEDDHAPPATMLEAFRLAPTARLCLVPKAWHTCFLDNFETTWAAIGPFLLAPDAASLTPSRKAK